MIAAQTTPRATGGYDFLADPSKRADEAPVFWHPDAHPAVVQLTGAPPNTEGLPFLPDQWDGDVVRRDAADGIHILIRAAGVRHQLFIAHPIADGAALAAVIPLDISAPHRAEATMRFWHHATYGRRRRSPAASRQSDRLTPILRALDGNLAGASYRIIAEGLFGTSRVAVDPWKTSPLRDRVIRLVGRGISLMQGGYRNLLRHGRRK